MNLTRKKIKITSSGKKRSQTTGADFVQMLLLKTMSLKTLNDQEPPHGHTTTPVTDVFLQTEQNLSVCMVG
jgi:hypothetical protein